MRAMIFDLDGTLLDRDASVQAFISYQYDRLIEWVGHVPKEQYVSLFLKLDSRGYVWKDLVYKQMVEDLDISLPWEQLLDDYVEKFRESCIPFPNLIQMLQSLRNNQLVLGMITNGKGTFQMGSLQALGIESYFEVILISECEGIKKPDAEIFMRAMRRLGAVPEECAYVGDHPVNDVEAARNAGMIGIWKRDPHWKTAEADYVIEDLMELVHISEVEIGKKTMRK